MKICLLCEGVTTTEQTLCSSCSTPLVPTSEVHFPVRRGEEDAGHPLIGSRIDGKYRLTSVLGKGGMGTVFRAVHEVSLVPVALKLLHPRFAQKSEHRAWFLAEARKAGRVIHENTARVQDVGEAEDGTVYIAMELVQGITLHEWMRAEVPSPALIVEILHQLCSALVAAHDVGLVHRDLTPRNVMVMARDGRLSVKILDFGISKGLPLRADSGETTSTGAPVGFANPPYSAPEHLVGQEVDARADLYSLGVIAYELISGRWPVEGRGTVALAGATIAGRLVPLVPRVRVPLRLQRLVLSLLSREPRARPASAAEVKRVLERMIDPQRGWLPTTAVVALLAAVAFAAFTWTSEVSPFLSSTPQAEPAFAKEPMAPDQAPRWLRSPALRELGFEFGGFAPAALRLDLFQHGRLMNSHGLAPEVAGRSGRLTLSAVRDPGFASALAEVSALSAGGSVDLVLAVPGRPPLGYARVRVDDHPPSASLTFEPNHADESGVLSGAATLACDVEEDIALSVLELVVAGMALGNEGQRVVALEPRVGTQSLRAGTVLGSLFPGVRRQGRLSLRLRAEDRAGNSVSSPALDFSGIDLHVPRILSALAPEGGRILTFGPRGARLRLHTSDSEDRLTVLVEDPDGKTLAYERPEDVTDRGLEILLRPNPGTAGFLDGAYQLRLKDSAGNLGEPYRETFTFRSEDSRHALRLPETVGLSHALLRGETLLVDGTAMAIELTCNPLYRPSRATLRPARPAGALPLSPGAALREAAFGIATLDLPSLGAGDFLLEVELSDARGEQPRSVTYSITSLPAAPILKLPEAQGARFLREFEQAGVLLLQDGKLRQGDAWRLVPPDARLVRTRIFHGQQQLAQVGFTSPEAHDAKFAENLPLVEGENSIAIALEDLLGRKVAVQLGESPAPLVRVGEDEVALVAHFWHATAPPEPVARLLRLEYGKPARLALRTPLPFREDADRTRIELTIEGAPIQLTRISNRGGDSILEFLLPFERVVTAAKLSERPPAEFAAEKPFRFAARLFSPAGVQQLELEGRTTRSVLQALRLEEIAKDPAGLPQVLREIRMIPIPRPIAGGPWRDPLPSVLAGRAAVRPEPEHEVRNLVDVYLQSGELTRAQYAAAVQRFLSTPKVLLPPPEQLVHAADPRREARLTASGMTPLMPAGHPVELATWAALGPSRPATGLDWFQAYTVARILSWELGDLDLLRLPLGVELERAAFATANPRPGERLHGATDPEGKLREGHRLAQRSIANPLLWPPTETESDALGDRVTTELGDTLVALDFGVREWTNDLPYVQDSPNSALLLEWLGDAGRHLEHASEFAAGKLVRGDLAPMLAVHGVVRGLATGEARELVDVLGSRATSPEALPPGVPGVVRTTYLRRDGGGLLPGERDPRLGLVGLRLCGSESFVTKARQR